MAKTIQYICITPRRVSHKYIGLHNISFETLKVIVLPHQNIERKQSSHHIMIISYTMKQKHIFKNISLCSIYHLVHIDSSK
jgi:hypothetical protein